MPDSVNTTDGTRHRLPAGSGRQRPGHATDPGTPGAATWVEASRWSPQRVRALGMVTDLVTAAAILGLSRNTAYALAREGGFPVPVLRVGRLYRVSVPALLELLGVADDPAGAGWT